MKAKGFGRTTPIGRKDFCFYEDAHIQKKVSEVFDIERFNVLQMPEMQPDYQSIIAKKLKRLNP